MNPKSPKTTAAGVISLIFSGFALFTQVWGAAYGTPLDPNQIVIGASGIATGIGLITAKDNKPPQ